MEANEQLKEIQVKVIDSKIAKEYPKDSKVFRKNQKWQNGDNQ